MLQKSRPITALAVWKWLTAGKASKVWWETVKGIESKDKPSLPCIHGNDAVAKTRTWLKEPASASHFVYLQLSLNGNWMNSNKLVNPFPSSAASSFPPLAQPCGNVTVTVCSMQIQSLHWSIAERVRISSASPYARTPISTTVKAELRSEFSSTLAYLTLWVMFPPGLFLVRVAAF